MAEKRKQNAHETDEENGDSDCEITSTTSSKAKKQRVFQKYRPEYTEKYAFILPSTSMGASHVRCTVCCVDFSVKHSGMWDVERHVKQDGHKKKEEAGKKQKNLANFFVSKPKPAAPSEDLDHKTLRAEAIMCQYIADSNLPLRQADPLVKKMKEMFPDSAIAKSK